MKLTIVLILISAMLVSAESYSQSTRLSLGYKEISIGQLLQIIEKQTDFRFAYSKSRLDPDQTVSIDVKNENLETILKTILDKNNLTYSIIDRYVVISDKNAPESINSQQAQKKVTGKVTDSSGQPLPGVTVMVKGTTNGTITDADGTYSLSDVPADGVLVFSFVGMKSQEVKVAGKTSVNATLAEETINIEQVVVTGYQTQKKADLTGSIGVVDVDKIKEVPTGNAVKALQGRVAGVYITTDGNPGSFATVRIRGGSTLSSGDNNPLYIIDGVPTTGGIEQLNPNDIESMQVLKDASAASIYGSRANNGVILITTKKGKEGVTKIEVSSYLTIQEYTNKMEVLNTEQRAFVNWQAAINDRVTPSSPLYQYIWHIDSNGKAILDNILYPEFIDVGNGQTMHPADTKWYDEISQQSLTQSHNFTLTNGNDKSHSLFSLNYFDNNGIIKETNSNKITARINSDYKVMDGKLLIGENLLVSKVDNVEIPAGDVMYLALVQQPIVPVYSLDGSWGGPGRGMTDRHNPVRLIEQNKQNHRKSVRIFGNMFADLEIMKGLNLRSSFGVDYNQSYLRKMDYSYVSGFLVSDINRVTTSQSHNISWTWSNTLNYILKKGKHDLNLVLGTEAYKYEDEWFYAIKEGFELEDPDYMYLNAGTESAQNGGGGAGNSLFSYFGKADYVYNGKYLATFTLRRDGTSRFGKKNLYGTFPAFSLGWRLSEDAIVKNNFNFISNLKLRAGWGVTGNQSIDNGGIYSIYRSDYGVDPTWVFDTSTAYDITGSDTGALPAGFRKVSTGNSSLKWEQANQTNLGLDFGLFDQKLYGNIDYFIKNTKDLLVKPPYLAAKGEGGDQWVNGASLENKGWELVLGYKMNLTKDLLMDLTANVSAYKRKVTMLPESVLTGYPGDPSTGKSILGHTDNMYFGYIADGIFKTQEEVDAHAAQQGKGIGRIRYKDIGGLDANGNFVYEPDGKVDDLDRTFIGNPDPDFIYGFNASLAYKGFDLNVFFQGIYGARVRNEYKHLTDFTSIWAGTNYGARTLDAWTPDNSDSTIPMLSLTDTNNENRASSYFIENGSYLKLRNLQLGYTIPARAIQRLHISSARIYVQGQNLFTLKDKKGNNQFTGVDPELPGFAYPIPTSYTIGINLTF